MPIASSREDSEDETAKALSRVLSEYDALVERLAHMNDQVDALEKANSALNARMTRFPHRLAERVMRLAGR